MVKNKKAAESSALAEIVINGIQEKKGKEIAQVDMRELKTASADYFVVCHGDSDKQVEAIARSVEEEVEKATGELPWHTEGLENMEWVLLDYINVVVHIFVKDKREFYGIEELWGDAEIKIYQD